MTRPTHAILPLLLLTACYTELGEVHCFADGDPRLEDGSSTLCCDPAGGDDADVACKAHFRGDGNFTSVADLAVCAPDGTCQIDCRDGANCECFTAADCETSAPCRPTAREDVCADHGQSERRCSICVECAEDRQPSDACADHPRGARCIDRTYCGCTLDTDCPDGTICVLDGAVGVCGAGG